MLETSLRTAIQSWATVKNFDMRPLFFAPFLIAAFLLFSAPAAHAQTAEDSLQKLSELVLLYQTQTQNHDQGRDEQRLHFLFNDLVNEVMYRLPQEDYVRFFREMDQRALAASVRPQETRAEVEAYSTLLELMQRRWVILNINNIAALESNLGTYVTVSIGISAAAFAIFSFVRQGAITKGTQQLTSKLMSSQRHVSKIFRFFHGSARQKLASASTTAMRTNLVAAGGTAARTSVLGAGNVAAAAGREQAPSENTAPYFERIESPAYLTKNLFAGDVTLSPHTMQAVSEITAIASMIASVAASIGVHSRVSDWERSLSGSAASRSFLQRAFARPGLMSISVGTLVSVIFNTASEWISWTVGSSIRESAYEKAKAENAQGPESYRSDLPTEFQKFERLQNKLSHLVELINFETYGLQQEFEMLHRNYFRQTICPRLIYRDRNDSDIQENPHRRRVDLRRNSIQQIFNDQSKIYESALMTEAASLRPELMRLNDELQSVLVDADSLSDLSSVEIRFLASTMAQTLDALLNAQATAQKKIDEVQSLLQELTSDVSLWSPREEPQRLRELRLAYGCG